MAATPVATQPVCTVRISGGLGNQLFQYAAGRSLAARTGARLQLDTSFYDRGRHRSFALDRFPIDADIAASSVHSGSVLLRTLRGLRTALNRLPARSAVSYREPHFHFDPRFEDLTPPVVLDGYFQSWRYFAACEGTIRDELQVPIPEDPESQRLAERVRIPHSIGLHIRRGDYVTNPRAAKVYAQCSVSYYREAIQRLPGDGPVLVLSDDLDWAKANLRADRILLFPESADDRSPFADLWLLTQCHHQVIANSSFSWWGAWLANRDGSRKVAPRQWFRDSDTDDSDLVPPEWLRI